MENILVALTILLILGLSIYRIIIQKRKGSKCASCPYSGACSIKYSATNEIVTQRITIK